MIKSTTLSKALYLTIAVMVLSVAAFAQESLGIINSNYAGITGVPNNPSSFTFSRLSWDVNVIGANISLDNNYVYFPSKSVVSGELFTGESKIRDYYTPNPVKEAYVNSFITLPSFAFNTGRHSFGLSFHSRTNISIEGLDYHLAKFMFDDQHLRYAPLQNKRLVGGPFYIASMAYADVSLNYSFLLSKTPRHMWAAGITVKKTFGLLGVYINGNNVDYSVTPDPAIGSNNVVFNIYSMNWDIGYSFPSAGSFIPGGGWGVDLGATYVRRKGAGKFVPFFNRVYGVDQYQYKIGAAIVDLGYVNFTQGARALNVNVQTDGVNPVIWNHIDTTKFSGFSDNSLRNFNDQLSVKTSAGGDPNGTFRGNGYYMGLPTAITLQGDFNINDRLYVAGNFVQPMAIMRPSVQRPAQLGVVPRLEWKYFEVAVPLSLYNYSAFRFGTAFRLGPLIVGTDKLSTYLGLGDVTGMDMYFAIKIYGLRENGSGFDPMRCFFKRNFKKFKLKKYTQPKIPVKKF